MKVVVKHVDPKPPVIAEVVVTLTLDEAQWLLMNLKRTSGSNTCNQLCMLLVQHGVDA